MIADLGTPTGWPVPALKAAGVNIALCADTRHGDDGRRAGRRLVPGIIVALQEG